MKKLLLGLMALSVAAFAANPGSGDEASVPVRVRAEVLDMEGLIITDASGTVLREVSLNHRIIKGQTGTAIDGSTANSVDTVEFRVVKGTKAADKQAYDYELPEGSQLKVSLDKDKTVLSKLGGTDVDKLTSTLTLAPKNGTVGAAPTVGKGYTVEMDKEGIHSGLITSTIPFTEANNTPAGVYDNASNMPILTVKYTAPESTK